MGAGISKVKQDYEAAESWVIKLGDDAKKTKAALVKLSESITGIKTKLQGTGLTDKQKEVLKEYYDEFRKIFKELSLVRGKQLKSFEDARHERDEAKMLFDSFMGIR
ncbi:hypothetical protein BASA61_000567 [Batrachochytrium salamandrivorans]|nr:hypothetical protein BASA61_000567 [Batrachochytrium salamandrivorans]